jgi:tRNA(Arg) A34 adenosine deaminase TadA
MKPNKLYMEAAIKLALQSKENGDYAIGSVIVMNNKIIAEGMNRVKVDEDPTQHAEIVAIRKASKKLKTRHLTECLLYTTHEPCPMCMGAILFARMKGLVFGARTEDMKNFRLKSQSEIWSWRTIDICSEEILEKSLHKLEIVKDFMREDCKKLFSV